MCSPFPFLQRRHREEAKGLAIGIHSDISIKMISRATLLRSSLQRLTVQTRPMSGAVVSKGSSLLPNGLVKTWYNTYVGLPVDRLRSIAKDIAVGRIVERCYLFYLGQYNHFVVCTRCSERKAF